MAAARPAALLALLTLIMLTPVLVVLALMVAASLGNPVLFGQTRGGLGSATFRIIKFRTMCDSRDAAGELLPDAARTTALGRILRRSRLDELPELVNIIAGDMAIVGPRPLLPETIAGMGSRGKIRAQVRPGLTGLAQVNGNTLLSDNEKLAYDCWYVRRRSFCLDCAILLRTGLVVLFGERRN